MLIDLFDGTIMAGINFEFLVWSPVLNSKEKTGLIVYLFPLPLVPSDLKKDLAGRKEYTDYLDQLEKQKADLRKRIASNKAWVVRK